MSATASLTLVSALDEREAAERRLAMLGMTAILAVGAVIRLVNINTVGLNSDEAVYSGQAAALAGDATYQQFFAIFRAHPLLVQFLLSVLFQFGVNDVAGRLLSVGFGLAAIALTYATGSLLFSRRVALLAAGVLAVMPYHVAVSRQMLLDGPEMTLWLLATYFLARYAAFGSPRWLYSAAFTAGLTVLAKETAILIVSDTGPTELIWKRANAAHNLKAVFLEASFPNKMAWLADVSKHLTPALFAAEVGKLKKQVAVIAVHIKARNRDEVVKELGELEIPGMEIGRFGKAYTF